jgi:hypothetical protein
MACAAMYGTHVALPENQVVDLVISSAASSDNRRSIAPMSDRSKAPLEGLDIAVEDAARPVVGRLGEVVVDGRYLGRSNAGALQQALDRDRGYVEQLGHVGRRPREHVAQDERGALARRQQLEPGDESEAHAVTHRHHLRRVAELIDDQVIGDRLEPRHVSGRGDGRAIRVVGGRPEPRGQGTPAGTVERVRQTFVAIRYIQVRTDDRCSKRSNARQARRYVSCTRSSASCTEPVIR